MKRWLMAALILALVGGLAAAAYGTRAHWQSWLQAPEPAAMQDDHHDEPPAPADRVVLSEQAQRNLALTSKPLRPSSYWKAIAVPGIIVDRPGYSDRSVVAPVNGVIQSIERVPGDTARPGETLFTLRILSESLHQSQTELFKATQDMKLTQALRSRLAAAGGVIPEARLIELDNQIARFEVAARAYRQELLTRGLSSEQIAGVADGRFVNEIPIVAPAAFGTPESTPLVHGDAAGGSTPEPRFEVQELKVELGQHVQAGQTLCLLADHQSLWIEGRAFRDETPLIERALRESWPVEVDFQETGGDWPPLGQQFQIAKLGTTIDPVNRTFAFYVPLENQSRSIDRSGRPQRLWRFRPGQKVRLSVPVEKLENVFVLPAEAVAFEGPEAFGFTQNVNTFIRRPLHVVLRDRHHVVVANDGSVVPGSFAVQNAAMQLNRMLKSQSGAAPKGYHMHADGSLHKDGEPD